MLNLEEDKTFKKKIVKNSLESIIEEKCEEVINDVTEQAKKTFLDLINESFTSLIIRNELLNTNIVISPELKMVIEKLMAATPDTLNDIEKAVQEIVKDNKIDSKDLPYLIIVVQRIYQVLYGFKDIKMNSGNITKMVSNVLKYLIHLLVINERIIVNDKQEFYKNCDTLIDSCVGLLGFSKSIKTKGCLQKLLGK
jgi:hypothetical protein